MADILSFPFATQQLRVVMRNGEPWFVAADVCAALTIGNNRDALARLDDDERDVGSIDTPSGTQQMGIVNESGLYSLILGSRKPEAKRFKKWVTSEVLPAIRKTGTYALGTPAKSTSPEVLSNADMTSIERLVHLVSHGFTYHRAFSMGIWFSVRKRTGRPSPERFHVSDLPIIADEIRRAWIVADALQSSIRHAEEIAVKRIIRKGEDADAILAQLHSDMAGAATKERAEFTNILNGWQDRELKQLMNRP
jgi:prophage antirepressor-like protein